MKYYLKLLFFFLRYFLPWNYLWYLVLFFLFVQGPTLLLSHLGILFYLPYEEYLGDLLATVIIFLSLLAFYHFMKHFLL